MSRAEGALWLRLRWLALAAPTLAILAADLVARGDRVVRFGFYSAGASGFSDGLRGAYGLAYLIAAAHSLVLWGSLLVLGASRRPAARRVGTALFVGLFALSVGVQAAFRARWSVYLSRDGTELSEHPMWAVLGTFRPRLEVALYLALAFATAIVLLAVARRLVRPTTRARRVAAILAATAIAAALAVPVSYRNRQATTPDLLWFQAAARAAVGPEPDREGLSSVQVRTPKRPEKLVKRDTPARNVVLVLQESQRADVSCVAPDVPCTGATRATHALTPHRLPLENLRANASSTTVAMGVLLTGLAPTASKADWTDAPNLFELADAAGYDTGYFTSQHLMFANMWLLVQDLPSGKVVVATHLDPEADMFVGADDALLSHRANDELERMREPFFMVVHYSNNHAPRRLLADGPFQPAAEGKGDMSAYLNNYKNTVARSDEAVAMFLEHLRSLDVGARTIVVYTADHGEAMAEHAQGCDHGCSLFEEDVRVPGWIDAPDGTLSREERENLTRARGGFVFHLDLAPTILDLLGLWDLPELDEARARMPGKPLTRALEGERAPVPLSNTTRIWERAVPSYGLMMGSRKLIGRHRDPGYACFDVARDPREEAPLERGCEDLQALADRLFTLPPSDLERLEDHPEWGEPLAP
ncbi:MAG: LTA synthase family protein [Polyangiaceae bacterium]